MSAARLIFLPLLVIDATTLPQVLVAAAVGKLSVPLTASNSHQDPDAVGYALIAVDPSGVALAAERKPNEDSAHKFGDAKPDSEKIAASTAAPSSAKNAVNPTSPQSNPIKPNALIGRSEGGQTSAEKPPSILQMVQGYETELLIAVAIALAFFFIGWICGGNYYLRRDRRRRTRLRF